MKRRHHEEPKEGGIDLAAQAARGRGPLSCGGVPVERSKRLRVAMRLSPLWSEHPAEHSRMSKKLARSCTSAVTGGGRLALSARSITVRNKCPREPYHYYWAARHDGRSPFNDLNGKEQEDR